MTVKTELEQRYREECGLKDCLPTPAEQCSAKPHTHVNKNGLLVECYHNCRNILASGAFWLGVTVSYPIEHFIYEKIWPFSLVGKLFGIGE